MTVLRLPRIDEKDRAFVRDCLDAIESLERAIQMYESNGHKDVADAARACMECIESMIYPCLPSD